MALCPSYSFPPPVHKIRRLFWSCGERSVTWAHGAPRVYELQLSIKVVCVEETQKLDFQYLHFQFFVFPFFLFLYKVSSAQSTNFRALKHRQKPVSRRLPFCGDKSFAPSLGSSFFPAPLRKQRPRSSADTLELEGSAGEWEEGS